MLQQAAYKPNNATGNILYQDGGNTLSNPFRGGKMRQFFSSFLKLIIRQVLSSNRLVVSEIRTKNVTNWHLAALLYMLSNIRLGISVAICLICLISYVFQLCPIGLTMAIFPGSKITSWLGHLPPLLWDQILLRKLTRVQFHRSLWCASFSPLRAII